MATLYFRVHGTSYLEMPKPDGDRIAHGSLGRRSNQLTRREGVARLSPTGAQGDDGRGRPRERGSREHVP
jgi:hypothetical protein